MRKAPHGSSGSISSTPSTVGSLHGWRRLDQRLRSSITEGIVVFLSLFDDNPAVHRTFCPPRSAYASPPKPGEPRPLAPLEELLESGHVLALNFPVGLNPGLARALGVMLKLDFQRAVLQRIPQDRGTSGADVARPPVRLRRVPRVRDGRRNRSDRRRAHVRAVASGAADSDRRDAEHQLAAIGAAGRRELAHVAAVLPHEVVPGDQRRVHRAEPRRICADGAIA